MWREFLTSITEDPSRFYGDTYYATYRGGAYERNEHWLTFFGGIAERIARDIAPGSVLDAGCAKGFLVEKLVENGIDAEGIDISEHALDSALPGIRPRLRVGSLLEPLERRYDLITCIEVIEHLEPRDGEAALANLCQHTDDIIISSTPDEYREATHVNVRPAEYWAELFARNGFVRDVGYDAMYISPWAARFRLAKDPWPRTIAAYERELARLVAERHQRTELLLEQDQQLSARDERRERTEQLLASRDQEHEELRSRLDAVEGDLATARLGVERLAGELTASRKGLNDARRQIASLEADLGASNATLDRLRRSLPVRVGTGLKGLARGVRARGQRSGKN